MLTELSRLSVEIDGYYAKDEQIDFLEDYFSSLESRFNSYEKLYSNMSEIIAKVEEKMIEIDPNLLVNSGGDFKETWRKEVGVIMRYTAAAMLFDDSERLQEGLLLWHKTIAKSYQFDRTCRTTFEIMPMVIKDYLNETEMALCKPFLSLNKISLG